MTDRKDDSLDCQIVFEVSNEIANKIGADVVMNAKEKNIL